MKIRPDFRGAESLLHRLAGIGTEFARYSNEDWPHLKNNEDFQQICRLPFSQKHQFEEFYAIGRHCAIFMSSRLRDFNKVAQFPTFADYVDSFAGTWTYQHENLESFIVKIQLITDELMLRSWAVERMIELFWIQLKLLEAVRHTIALLKKSNIYLIDKGEAPMESPHTISIGNINGKVNINSIDNSTTHKLNSSLIFHELKTAISSSTIQESDKSQLLSKLDELKAAEGSPTYVQKYKDFVQNAATHMSVVGPLLPALTGLIG